MALDRISILDFRNHRQTALEDTARFNLLVGANGAGKTNVLEALSLLAPGRGLRRAKLPEMARIDGPGGFTVAARLQPADGAEPVQLGTVVDAAQPNRRRVRVNGAERSALGLSEWLSVRWLTPAMDGLFPDSAGARRRYLDRLALATAPGHAALSNRYETALRNRNRLLSDDAPPDPQWLDALEAQLAEHGAAIAANRRALVEELNRELEAQADALFPRPLLAIEPTGPEEHTALADALRGNRRTERRAGRTLIGPHRAELAVTLADKGVPAARA
ncbi:MAG: AAA family ATPase, partial [Pseudomonadota bacterium]|nr:AAA family ATPase [Pseudomonadota bacterium]